MHIDSRLLILIAKHFNLQPENITSNTSKDEIEDWDSLEHIKLILEIEEEFKIKFSLDAVPLLTSVKAIQEEINKTSI